MPNKTQNSTEIATSVILTYNKYFYHVISQLSPLIGYQGSTLNITDV